MLQSRSLELKSCLFSFLLFLTKKKNKKLHLFLWPSSLLRLSAHPWFSIHHFCRKHFSCQSCIKTKGSPFSPYIYKNLKQQQGPHENLLFNCPSSCWVLLWKVTHFSHRPVLFLRVGAQTKRISFQIRSGCTCQIPGQAPSLCWLHVF